MTLLLLLLGCQAPDSHDSHPPATCEETTGDVTLLLTNLAGHPISGPIDLTYPDGDDLRIMTDKA